AEPRHLLLIPKRSHFRITAQVADEHHAIDHDSFLRPARAFPKGSPAAARTIWAVTVPGDQPPPTRCPAPSQSSPSELFWLALSPRRRVQPEKSEPDCAQRNLSVGSGRGAPPTNP